MRWLVAGHTQLIWQEFRHIYIFPGLDFVCYFLAQEGDHPQSEHQMPAWRGNLVRSLGCCLLGFLVGVAGRKLTQFYRKDGYLWSVCCLAERGVTIFLIFIHVAIYISACIIPLTNLVWRKTVAVGIVELVDVTCRIG